MPLALPLFLSTAAATAPVAAGAAGTGLLGTMLGAGTLLGGVGSILGATRRQPTQAPAGQMPGGVAPSEFVFTPQAIYGQRYPEVQPLLGVQEQDYGLELFRQYSELMKGGR